MGRYLLKRLGFALLLVFVVSSAALLLTKLAPGGFWTEQCLNMTPDECNALIKKLGLDRSLWQQYIEWLGGVIRFDFGTSLLYLRPVSEMIRQRALNTAILAIVALFSATLIGIPLGIFSGTSRGLARSIIRVVSILGTSIPPLIGSLALVFLAARTGWLPVGGMTSNEGIDLGWSAWLVDVARHIAIPALALAIPLASMLERLQSEAIETAVQEPFVAASRARGVDRLRAILRHAWPASLRPVLGFYGIMIGTAFSGSFIVEVVTSWPGLGRLMYEALRARDLFLVAGCAATGAFFLAAGTLLADLLLAVTDPRVSSGDRV
jgi:peptide/nickel transport system permease protein